MIDLFAFGSINENTLEDNRLLSAYYVTYDSQDRFEKTYEREDCHILFRIVGQDGIIYLVSLPNYNPELMND